MNLLRKLKLTRIDLVGKGANPGAFITLFKRATDAPEEETQVDQDTATKLRAENEELKKANVDLTAKVAELTLPEPEPDPIEKANPEVRKMLDEVRKEAADAKAKLAKIEDDNATMAYITKAAEFEPAFGKAAEFGPLLRKMEQGLSEAERVSVIEKLRSLVAIAKDSVHFKELGVVGSPEPAGAWDKIQKMADELVQKAEGKLKTADAVSAVLKTPQGAALYTDYLKEKER